VKHLAVTTAGIRNAARFFLRSCTARECGRLEQPLITKREISVPERHENQCQIELVNYNKLPDKVGAPTLILESYLKAFQHCSGPQYANAIAEIERILGGTQTPPRPFSGGKP